MSINQNHSPVFLTTTPTKIREANDNRSGLIVQNQEDTATIYLRSGGDGNARSYLKFAPLGDMMQDVLAPTAELWAYSDTNGAVLTLVEQFRGV